MPASYGAISRSALRLPELCPEPLEDWRGSGEASRTRQTSGWALRELCLASRRPNLPGLRVRNSGNLAGVAKWTRQLPGPSHGLHFQLQELCRKTGKAARKLGVGVRCDVPRLRYSGKLR